MKLRDANLQLYGKNFFTHPPSRILLSFSQNTHDWLLFPKNLWKCTSTISFWKCKWKVVLLIIYPFNYDSSTTVHPSEFFHVELCHLLFSRVQFQINLNSLFLAIIKRSQEHPSFCSVFWHALFWHTRKVGPRTLRWDAGLSTLGWDSKVRTWDRTLRRDPKMGLWDETLW